MRSGIEAYKHITGKGFLSRRTSKYKAKAQLLCGTTQACLRTSKEGKVANVAQITKHNIVGKNDAAQSRGGWITQVLVGLRFYSESVRNCFMSLQSYLLFSLVQVRCQFYFMLTILTGIYNFLNTFIFNLKVRMILLSEHKYFSVPARNFKMHCPHFI